MDYLILAGYAGLLIGIAFLFKDNFAVLFRDLRFGKPKKENRLQIHLKRIFQTLYGEKAVGKMYLFLMITILLFTFCGIFGYQIMGMTGIAFSLIIALMPYLYLRSKLAIMRLDASYEGETLISELLNQYKINRKNIIEAIDATVVALTVDEPISKRALLQMSIRLKTYQTDDELREILDDFIYVIHTEWSKMLCNNIYNACAEKADITSGLNDLMLNCKKINSWLERSKKSNMESMAMIKFLGPVTFAIFLYLLYSMMEYSISEIAFYQLQTETGLMIFFALMIVFSVNVIVINLLRRQKFDL